MFNTTHLSTHTDRLIDTKEFEVIQKMYSEQYVNFV